MPDEVKKRGRPPKKQVEQIVETSTVIHETEYEFNSFVSNGGLIDAVFSCGIFNYFSKNQIDNILRDPITYHEEAIKLSNFVYGKNGARYGCRPYKDEQRPSLGQNYYQ